jgi:hypothetical protein
MKIIPRLCLSAVAMLAMSACAADRRPPDAKQSATPTPANSGGAAKVDAATPVDGRREQIRRAGAGTFNQYKFAFERAGGEVEATFAPTRLPWDDALVVAAAREVIVAAYDDRSENFPRPVVWPYRGAEVNAIKLEGENFEYVFVPLREEAAGGTRQVRAIVFWQLAKGTVR